MSKISKQENKKAAKVKKGKKEKKKKKVVEKNSKKLEKITKKKVAKTTNVAVFNENLLEKFSIRSKNLKRRKCNKNWFKRMRSPDGMCWYGVDCRRNFCWFEHPPVNQYFNRYLILRYKKEIESRNRKKYFKKGFRFFINNLNNHRDTVNNENEYILY
jgi:hypothetical protein